MYVMRRIDQQFMQTTLCNTQCREISYQLFQSLASLSVILSLVLMPICTCTVVKCLKFLVLFALLVNRFVQLVVLQIVLAFKLKKFSAGFCVSYLLDLYHTLATLRYYLKGIIFVSGHNFNCTTPLNSIAPYFL